MKDNFLKIVDSNWAPGNYEGSPSSIFERNHSKDYWEKRGLNQGNINDVSGINCNDEKVLLKKIDLVKDKVKGKAIYELCAGGGRWFSILKGYPTIHHGLERSTSMFSKIPEEHKIFFRNIDVIDDWDPIQSSYDVVFMDISVSSVYNYMSLIFDKSLNLLNNDGCLLITETTDYICYHKNGIIEQGKL